MGMEMRTKMKTKTRMLEPMPRQCVGLDKGSNEDEDRDEGGDKAQSMAESKTMKERNATCNDAEEDEGGNEIKVRIDGDKAGDEGECTGDSKRGEQTCWQRE